MPQLDRVLSLTTLISRHRPHLISSDFFRHRCTDLPCLKEACGITSPNEQGTEAGGAADSKSKEGGGGGVDGHDVIQMFPGGKSEL